MFFFFFKQKTAYEMRISDWSSDVCSSDLRRSWTWDILLWRAPSARADRTRGRGVGFRSAELSAKRGVELRRSKLGPRDALLPHIFPRAAAVARLARLVTLEEQELARAVIGIDFGGQGGGVRKFERHMPFPAGFERGDVHDDAAARIGRLAEADHQDVAGDAEIFDRAGERKAVRRDDAAVGFAADEILGVEFLGIERGRIDVGAGLELGGRGGCCKNSRVTCPSQPGGGGVTFTVMPLRA